MSHLFISYSSRHRDVTEQLLADLRAAGWSHDQIWWDDRLRGGDVYWREIADALQSAAAVIVVWTEEAVDSDWVYAEANRGRALRRLVQAVDNHLNQADLPMPFDALHVESLSNRERLLEAIRRRASGEEASEPSSDVGNRLLLDDKRVPLPTRRAARAPSALLQARHRIAPFLDVAGYKQALVNWATDGEPLAGRLIHAPGGYGKTRLLIETLATLESEHGWLCGFIPRGVRDHDAREQALQRMITRGREAPGLCLVVDYAEGRKSDVVWLCQQLLEREDKGGPPARLVLLARSAGEWWRDLEQKHDTVAQVFGAADLQLDTASLEAPPTGQQCERLYHDSMGAFRQALGRPSNDETAPPQGLGPELDRPLAVHMRALLDVYHVAPGANVGKLLDNILGEERKYWDTASGSPDRPLEQNRVTEIERGAALTTLALGLTDRATAEDLLARDDYFNDAHSVRQASADLEPVLTELVSFYGGTEYYLTPVEPDLVGEHLVATCADERLVEATLAWAEDAAERRRAILTVLNRATRHEHGPNPRERARAHLQLVVTQQVNKPHWASDIIETAIHTQGALPAIVEEAAPHLTLAGLQALAQAMPMRTLRLANTAHAVAAAYVVRARAMLQSQPSPSEHDRGVLANALLRLGHDEHQSRRPKEALAATHEAVDLYRELAAGRPHTYRGELARALTNLGTRLSTLNRNEDALKTTQEAVDIHRDIAADQPDIHNPELGRALNNLGLRLWTTGRTADALTVMQEALGIRRQLAWLQPDTYTPELARALVNLGIVLSAADSPQNALKATQEGINRYRELTATRPDAYTPELARALNNLATRLQTLGHSYDALTATREAIDRYRQLAELRPEAYNPDLAATLNSLAQQLVRLDDPSKAHAAVVEAIQCLAPHMPERRDAFTDTAREMLDTYRRCLSAAGRAEDEDLISPLTLALHNAPHPASSRYN